MKKMIVIALAMLLAGCATPFKDDIPVAKTGYHTEFHPYFEEVNNCLPYSADVYLINGTPSLLYMCNDK